MKNKIRHAFYKDTPDVWDSILRDFQDQSVESAQVISSVKVTNRKFTKKNPLFWHYVLEFASTAAVLLFAIGAVGGMLYMFSLWTDHNSQLSPHPTYSTTPPTTNTSDPIPSDPTIQKDPTDPTSIPTSPTDPIIPNVDPLQLDMEISSYCTPERNRYMFYRYDGILLPFEGEAEPDVSQCVEGCFYIFDYDQGMTYFVAEQVLEFDYTSEHLYFVSEDEPTKIYRMTLDGKNRTLVYESDNSAIITHIQYDGSDASGVLLLAQNSKEILSYDLKTGETKKILEAYHIESFIYRHSSISEPWVELHMGSSERGEMLYLEGQYDALDTRPRESYLYFFETGELYARRFRYLGLNKGYGYQYVEYVHEEPTMTDHYSFESSPNYLLVAPYHLDDPHAFEYPELVDTSACVDEWLYSYNEATGEIILICAEPILQTETDYEYVYYVTQNDPNTIRYSTLDGMKAGIIYTGGEITKIQDCGYQTRLFAFVEDKSVFKIMDLETGTIETVYTHSDANVFSAYFFSGYNVDGTCGIVASIEIYLDDGRIYGYNIETKELEEIHYCED